MIRLLLIFCVIYVITDGTALKMLNVRLKNLIVNRWKRQNYTQKTTRSKLQYDCNTAKTVSEICDFEFESLSHACTYAYTFLCDDIDFGLLASSV